MLVLWPDAADALRDLLRRHGLDPARVDSPAAAWPVFRQFLAVDIDGTCDRFAVSWGCPDWSDGLPALSFVRRLTTGGSKLVLSLDMVFRDLPDFADVAELNTRDSGFYPVPLTDETVAEALWEVERYPALRSMWTGSPSWSTVSFGVVHSPGRDPDTFDARQIAAYLDYRARNG